MDEINSTKLKIGLVGPIDLGLLQLDKEWPNIPTGNEYPLFSYFANDLVKRNYKVYIFTISPNIIESAYYEDDNFKIFVLPKIDRSPLFYYIDMSEKLKNLILSNPPNFLFAQWTYEYGWAAIKSKIDSSITIHDNAWRIFIINPSLNKLVKYVLNNYIIYKADRLIAVSDYIYNILSIKSKNKTKIISNFYPQYFDTIMVPPQDKKKYFVTLCNGYGIRTNAKIALEAFKIFSERNKGYHFTYHLIGLGTEINSELYYYALKIGAPINRIHFHGYLPHPKAMEILKDATLLIHPSLEEANCISIIEAMALGVPVLGNKLSPGVLAQLDNDKGVLFENNSSNLLVQKMELILANPDMQVKMAKLSLEYARSNYFQKLIVDKLIAIIPKVNPSKA